MIEVNITQGNFLKVKETLSRIGIANNRTKTLYQSCHVLKKQDKFYIVHFKEMLVLDGNVVELSSDDIIRLNSIALLLEQWGLLTLVHPNSHKIVNNFRVISYKDKPNWNLVPKYIIGD